MPFRIWIGTYHVNNNLTNHLLDRTSSLILLMETMTDAIHNATYILWHIVPSSTTWCDRFLAALLGWRPRVPLKTTCHLNKCWRDGRWHIARLQQKIINWCQQIIIVPKYKYHSWNGSHWTSFEGIVQYIKTMSIHLCKYCRFKNILQWRRLQL